MNVDRDPSSPAQLDFAEFFVGVFNYCTLTHDTLVKFAFDLFDKDGSGAIARDELEQLVEIVYGQAAVDEKASKVIRMMDRDRDGLVELLEFRQIERRVPSLLKPAFELQQQLQQKLLGRKFWNGATRRRCANMGSEDLIEWYFALKNGEALVRLEVNEEAAGRQELEREQMLQQGEVLNPEGVHALGGPSANAERLHIVPFQTRCVCYAQQRVAEEGPPPADPGTEGVGGGVGGGGGERAGERRHPNRQRRGADRRRRRRRQGLTTRRRRRRERGQLGRRRRRRRAALGGERVLPNRRARGHLGRLPGDDPDREPVQG
jgi:hypothetical protein